MVSYRGKKEEKIATARMEVRAVLLFGHGLVLG
jgi:hypothetical protein